MLLQNDSSVQPSISYTTWRPRLGKQTVANTTLSTWKPSATWVARGEFIEWAKCWQSATAPRVVDCVGNGGRARCAAEIDWQGRNRCGSCSRRRSAFSLMPPSMDEWLATHRRATDSDEVIARWLVARDEMRHVAEFDCVIINGERSWRSATCCPWFAPPGFAWMDSATATRNCLTICFLIDRYSHGPCHQDDCLETYPGFETDPGGDYRARHWPMARRRWSTATRTNRYDRALHEMAIGKYGEILNRGQS